MLDSLKFIQVGNIIREEILNYPNTENKNNEEDTRIIILGGSQGAKIFGEVIPKAILNLVKKNIKLNILQQVLPEQKDDIELFYKKNMIKNYTFIFDKNIISLMAKSDLAISRSGASTLAELDFLQIPFIAVPYPHAKDNHQYENALYYKKKQSCWILDEINLNEENLTELLLKIISNNDNLFKKKKISKKENEALNLIKKEINI